MKFDRIWIYGRSNTRKTTLARALATQLGVEYSEQTRRRKMPDEMRVVTISTVWAVVTKLVPSKGDIVLYLSDTAAHPFVAKAHKKALRIAISGDRFIEAHTDLVLAALGVDTGAGVAVVAP